MKLREGDQQNSCWEVTLSYTFSEGQMRRTSIVTAALLAILVSSPALAQSLIRPGQVEVNGNTSLAFSRQSVSAEGDAASVNNDTSALSAGFAYYLTRMVGIGLAGSYQKASFGAPGEKTAANSFSNTAIGPMLRLRFPVGDRAALILTGAGGLNKIKVSGSDFTSQGDTDGKFVSAGAGINFFFVDAASINLGASYTRSTLTPSGAEEGTNSTGLNVAVGFSILLGGR
jgi:hypothetical protein